MLQKKKEEFILQYVDRVFESSSTQDIAVSFSQLPDFAKDSSYVNERLSRVKKK